MTYLIISLPINTDRYLPFDAISIGRVGMNYIVRKSWNVIDIVIVSSMKGTADIKMM